MERTTIVTHILYNILGQFTQYHFPPDTCTAPRELHFSASLVKELGCDPICRAHNDEKSCFRSSCLVNQTGNEG